MRAKVKITWRATRPCSGSLVSNPAGASFFTQAGCLWRNFFNHRQVFSRHILLTLKGLLWPDYYVYQHQACYHLKAGAVCFPMTMSNPSRRATPTTDVIICFPVFKVKWWRCIPSHTYTCICLCTQSRRSFVYSRGSVHFILPQFEELLAGVMIFVKEGGANSDWHIHWKESRPDSWKSV